MSCFVLLEVDVPDAMDVVVEVNEESEVVELMTDGAIRLKVVAESLAAAGLNKALLLPTAGTVFVKLLPWQEVAAAAIENTEAAESVLLPDTEPAVG